MTSLSVENTLHTRLFAQQPKVERKVKIGDGDNFQSKVTISSKDRPEVNATKSLVSDISGQRIVIATNMRSGSSFIGELLKSDPNTFYSFEPLMLMDVGLHRGKKKCESYKLPALVDLLYNCTVSKLKFCSPGPYWLHKVFGQSSANFKAGPKKCSTKEHRVAKTIRSHNLETLIHAVAARGGFVLYLVRDPRGIMTSRKQIYDRLGKSSQLKAITSNMCSRFNENLNYLSSGFNNQSLDIRRRVAILRYEDFAYAPREMAEGLYKFLGREMHTKVVDYINTHTNLRTKSTKTALQYSKTHTYSTKRDSNKTAEAWREKIRFADLNFIQKTCSYAMETFGYVPVHNVSVLHDKTFSLVTTLTADLPILH